jgi:hypothetical protein
MVDPDNNHENDTPPSPDGGFISSRPWVMDYVDVNGLSNRIGLPKDRDKLWRGVTWSPSLLEPVVTYLPRRVWCVRWQ